MPLLPFKYHFIVNNTFNPLITNKFMAITNLEKIFVVEMINVETYDVTTLPNAFLSFDAAYDYIDECKQTDERVGTSEWWTYRVRTFNLFR